MRMGVDGVRRKVGMGGISEAELEAGRCKKIETLSEMHRWLDTHHAAFLKLRDLHR
jgi:hypothetical protein